MLYDVIDDEDNPQKSSACSAVTIPCRAVRQKRIEVC